MFDPYATDSKPGVLSVLSSSIRLSSLAVAAAAMYSSSSSAVSFRWFTSIQTDRRSPFRAPVRTRWCTARLANRRQMDPLEASGEKERRNSFVEQRR